MTLQRRSRRVWLPWVAMAIAASPVQARAFQEPSTNQEPIRVVGSLPEVALESVFGPLQPDAWRPLGLDTLFSEGWDEAYAPAPGDAPRQTWINSVDGAFYRLFVFSFNYGRAIHGVGNVYGGEYFLFTPLSRRLELGWFVPFVASGPDAGRPPGSANFTDFGDLTIAPRVLLAEDRRYTVTTNLFIRMPTGNARNGNGAASLSPDLEFWANPFGRWVARGGVGVTVPTNETPIKRELQEFGSWTGFNASPAPFTSFDARLALGLYVTPADAKFFKNLVFSTATNFHTQLSGGRATYFSMTPGLRFGMGKEWYFLLGLEVPVVGPRPFSTQTFVQLIHNF